MQEDTLTYDPTVAQTATVVPARPPAVRVMRPGQRSFDARTEGNNPTRVVRAELLWSQVCAKHCTGLPRHPPQGTFPNAGARKPSQRVSGTLPAELRR